MPRVRLRCDGHNWIMSATSHHPLFDKYSVSEFAYRIVRYIPVARSKLCVVATTKVVCVIAHKQAGASLLAELRSSVF